MKPREKFLQNILNKVQEHQRKANEFQRVYDFNKDLPEEFFENLSDSEPIASTTQTPLAAKTSDSDSKENTNEYGINRKIVVRILNGAQEVMRKVSIAEEFKKLNSNYSTDEDAMTAVTNVLTALKSDGVIMGYKPENAKFRGLYWGLAAWFDGDKAKKEFEAKPHNALSNYLVEEQA